MPPEFDALVPNYLRAKNRWLDAPNLSSHYQTLSHCYSGNGHGLVEMAKSFLECVCLTVLGEFGETMPNADPPTTQLLVKALQLLGCENSRGASKFDKVLSGYNKLADALSDMRNQEGSVAHGKDGFLDTLADHHSRAFLLIGDTILSVLLSAHDGTEPDLRHTREPYERFAHLHRRIDKAASMEVEVEEVNDEQVLVVRLSAGTKDDEKEFRIEPSRLLYALDRTAYIDVLKAAEVHDVGAESEVPVEVGPSKETTTPEVPPEVVHSSEYGGRFAQFKDKLQESLLLSGLDVTAHKLDDGTLLDSILSTADANAGKDWTERESQRARMKVALRRLLTGSGIGTPLAQTAAEHIVSWLDVQVARRGLYGGTKDEQGN